MISYYSAPGVPHIKGHRHRKLSSLSEKQEQIIKITCAYFEITKEDIAKRCKKMFIVYRRSILAYLLYNVGQITLVEAAKFFGVHHCSIVYYRIVVEGQLTAKMKNSYQTDVATLINLINSTTI